MTLYETLHVDESLFFLSVSFETSRRGCCTAVSMGNGQNGLHGRPDGFTGLAAIQLLQLEEREKEAAVRTAASPNSGT